MDLKALRAFVKVAELGNISQAAISLGLTQSSLSRIIAALEKDLGGPLFHRTGRGVALTEIGESAVGRARNLVIDSEQLVADIRESGQAPSGVVTLAVLPSVLRSIAGDLFEEVRGAYPGVILRMLEGFSGQIEEWLAEGRADIAILSRYRETHTRDEEVLTRSYLMRVGVPDGKKARRTVAFRELAKVPLVLPAAPNGLRLAVDDVARRLRVKLNVVFEADSLEAQKAIVGRQGCHAVLSPQTITKEVAAGVFLARRIVDPDLPRLVVMSTTTHRPLSRAAREVARIVRRLVVKVGI